ncbi:serine O-acetyltransferase [Neobacillus drentensis]|uniref:serine O-acetyltransferase n=1 Tax=Neobacillus drentensis TaxID=220684 RepID=UPI0008244B11|nr:serine acetyltransferase [Neobacillus drentensis]
MNVYNWYLFSRRLAIIKIPLLPNLVTYLIRFIFGCYVPYTADIGKGTKLGYGGLGIVIHRRATIGKDCTINSGVTIGGTTKKYEVPILGDNVYVGTGAKVIGNVKIGSNVVIGANAVVLNDIPDNCLAVGVPAKIVKENIEISKYI